MTLPPSGKLIPAVRELDEHLRDAFLDTFQPDIDAYADTAEIAKWLGRSPLTIHRERKPDRARANGTVWPEPDHRFGHTPVWRYRTIVLYRAAQPGSGNRRTERTV